MRMGSDPRAHMVRVAQEVWARGLSDSGGGNMSVRSGGRIYLTPRYLGSRYRWELTPRRISVLDAKTKTVLSGPVLLSREAAMHLAIYEALPEAGAVIHAHPRHVMVFACTGTPLPPVMEHTWKFGQVGFASPAPAHSPELAESVAKALVPLRPQLCAHGIAVLLPAHGIVCVGRDLDEAFDTLDRLELNARVALLARLLGKELLPPR